MDTFTQILLGIYAIVAAISIYNIGRLSQSIKENKKIIKVLNLMDCRVTHETTKEWYEGAFWVIKNLK